LRHFKDIKHSKMRSQKLNTLNRICTLFCSFTYQLQSKLVAQRGLPPVRGRELTPSLLSVFLNKILVTSSKHIFFTQ